MSDTTATATPLSIGDVARLSGVPVETLRIWERRYGKPEAQRLPSGHRRYDAGQVTFLRRVAEAVAHGVRASAAVRATPDELDQLLAARRPQGREIPGDWLDPVRRMDDRPLRALLRAEAAGRGPAAFANEVVGPLLTAVGRAWADGRIDVRHEHLASQVIAEELRGLAPPAPPSPRAPVIVLATLPGERHALGALLAALVAAHAGAACVVLGADTPVGEIAATVRERGAAAVAVSVSSAHGGIDADAALAELREALPASVRLFVGGAGSRRPGRARAGIHRVEDFEEFAVHVRALGDASPLELRDARSSARLRASGPLDDGRRP